VGPQAVSASPSNDNKFEWQQKIFFNLYSGRWNPIGSTRHCGQQWPIVPAPADYDDGQTGGMIGRGNRSTRRKPALVPLCYHKPHMLLGREPGPPRWEASD
jgi:hypothetical protein